jgi:RNA polymerase sigma-70 factor, ECF subfamily
MTSSPQNLGLLIQRAIKGDRPAIDQLLLHFRPQLRRMIAVRMDTRLRARLDPSDIVQIVLAHAAASMATFERPAEEFFPWLRQMAWDELSRLHRDHVTTQKRSVTLEQRQWFAQATDESMARLADQLAAKQLGPRSQAVHRELRARVRAALEQLAVQDREVLVLRFLEQLSITDTAAALGLSEAAVKSRQFRAVDRKLLATPVHSERQPRHSERSEESSPARPTSRRVSRDAKVRRSVVRSPLPHRLECFHRPMRGLACSRIASIIESLPQRSSQRG